MNTIRFATLAFGLALAFAPRMTYAEEPKKEGLAEDSPEERSKKRDEKLNKLLARNVSFDFVEIPPDDALKFLTSLTRIEIVAKYDDAIPTKPLNLRVQDMRLENALKWIALLNGLKTDSREGVFFLIPKDKNDAAPAAPAELTAQEKKDIADIEKTLERKVSFEFKYTPLADGLAILGNLTKAAMVVDPKAGSKAAAATISLKVKDMDLNTALKSTLKLAELDCTILRSGDLHLRAGKKVEGFRPMKTIAVVSTLALFLCAVAARAEETAEEKIRKAMSRKVSFEFVDTPLSDTLQFVRQLTNLPIVVDPKVAADGKDKTPINLRVADMDLDKALQWTLKLAELEYKIQDQAVFIFPIAQKEAPPPPAATRQEREKEPPALDGVLRARFASGEAIEADATMLRHFPQLEREILSLAFDPQKDAILALSLGVDIPERVPLDAFIASAKKVAPDAKFDRDDALNLLLVRSKDADDLRRINAIARALRRGTPDAAQANAPRKITVKLADVPLKRALVHLARLANIAATVVSLDKTADDRFVQSVSLDVTDMEFNACLQLLSRMTDLRIELKGNRIECATIPTVQDKPAAIKPPRPPAEVEKPQPNPPPNGDPQF